MPTDSNPGGSLLDRFPALRRLETVRTARRVPYVQQTGSTDCASACLAMILRYHGKRVTSDELRGVAGASRDGVNGHDLLREAAAHGLRGRGVRCEPDDLAHLPLPAILHWEFKHFVVLERCDKAGVEIVDPGRGRRRVSPDQLRRSFTGVALTLEPTEEFEPGGANSDLIWRYVKRIAHHTPLLARIVVSSAMVQVFALALPLLTAALVDRVVPRQDQDLLLILMLGVLGMTMFQVMASTVRSHLLLHLRAHLDTRITCDFVHHLVALPYGFFQRRSAGDLIMRLNSNTTIREILTSGAMSGLLDGVMVGGYLILLFAIHPYMGFLVFLLGLLRVSVFLVLRRRYRQLMSESLEVQAGLQNYQVEMFNGMETLKASGFEHRALESWSNRFVDVLNVSLTRGRLGITEQALMGLLNAGSPLLILGYGGHLVIDGSLSLGAMLALSAVAAGFLGPLTNLVGTAQRFNELGSYFERIKDVLDTPVEQDRQSVAHVTALAGKVTVSDLSFRYGPTSPIVVDGVSLEVLPGQSVAIVGPSGSGKSTLAKLLVGLYPPTRGHVLHDDRDLTQLEHRSVRRLIGYVPQQPYLFAGSVRDNITLGEPEAPLDRVIRAARLAHIHDDIEEMPMSYETPVSDGAASLAAGQRQRLALARALLSDPAVLLLDEATSSLDAVSEMMVMRNLDGLGCTKIMIAHRLSTIMHADLILVMRNGSVVEQGTHGELMTRDGAYSALVAAQLTGR